MTESPDQATGPDEDTLLTAKLTAETAKIPWRELQRFFAQGRAIAIRDDTDLIAVGIAVSRDAADRVKAWVASGCVGPVSDEQARQWVRDDALVWALVVRPWVLVQPVRD